jgi:hypothetical protein
MTDSPPANFAGWTTRLDPAMTRRFGVEEVHRVCFEPPSWPGSGAAVTLLIPECETHVAIAGPSADAQPLIMVNRPPKNRNVKQWTRAVCDWAMQIGAFLTLSRDTAEQAAKAAKRVAKRLPKYQRVALERMHDPASRARARLS